MSSSDDPRRVVVLDFDGVLCDSLAECTLVAYLAHEGLPSRSFVDPGLAGVPNSVIQRIARCRPFMRHLGHFIVPLRSTGVVNDRADFNARYEEVPKASVEAFIDAAVDVRQAVRSTYEPQWLAQQHVDARLATLAAGAYIATARDAASVINILRAHAIETDRNRIFGSLREKVSALRSIATLESVDRACVVLVDDSIENCLAATAAGYGAEWASWGYHEPGDADTARAHRILALTVDDLAPIPLPRLISHPR